MKASKIIKQGTSLLYYRGCFSHKNKYIRITIKDTYKLISKPLRDFGECFGLEQTKEVMPYSLQTEANVTKRYLSRLEVMKADELVEHENISGLDKKVQTRILKNMSMTEQKERAYYMSFWLNCEKWGCYDEDNDKFDLIKYASKYCEMDCIVLEKGYGIFNDWMIEATGLSIYSHLTIPSLVHEFFIQQGCYLGVKECSGVVRAFIQKCVVGGRTMLRNNEKCRILGDTERCESGESFVTGGIADYDAVSLYPSAMARMAGFLIGYPKVLNSLQMNYDFLKRQDGYFIKIDILSIGKPRPFPLMSELRDGVRCFENENLKGLYVDKVSLEDLVKFQDVKFQILQGYYFNEGRNDKIKEVISGLFVERLIKKKAGNPIQEIYKLIMNSSYGKSIIRPVEHSDKILSTTRKKDNFVSTNFASIEHFTQIQDSTKWIVRSVVPIASHYSIPQVGVEILSMSKRIMNEVVCLADDNDIMIYYQDTDSLHMDCEKLPTLFKLYKNKYDRVLDGNNMGQFNSDFKLKVTTAKGAVVKCRNVHSVMFIGLGKKCYLDVLKGEVEAHGVAHGHTSSTTGIDEVEAHGLTPSTSGIDEEKKVEIKYGLHMRMKGVSRSCVPFTAKSLFNGDIVELYERLYKGDKIKFDMLEGGKKCSMTRYKNMTIGNRSTFTRELKF
jgi:hypothetical protein